jgi:class 3 adenylate cyclase
LEEHRELLRLLLPKFNGRMVGEIGDGTLTRFHSAIDAVNCAREVQAHLQDQPELKVRIGIHLGDVKSLRKRAKLLGFELLDHSTGEVLLQPIS